MGSLESSSVTLLNRALTTSDLIYTNLHRRYPKDNQKVFVNRVVCELNQCERLLSRLWLIMSHKRKLATVFMLEEFNFALLRTSWKPDFLRVYNQRFLPLLESLDTYYIENQVVLLAGMTCLYSSIDNQFLPDKTKESLFHDPTESPPQERP